MINEISAKELCEAVGDDIVRISDDFVGKYFQITERIFSSVQIRTRIIKNEGDSFSVYEQEHGDLLVLIRKTEKRGWFVQPMGIANIMASKILNEFNLIEYPGEFMTSAYNSLFVASESDEPLDKFVFYMGVILIDELGLDIYKTFVDTSERDVIVIDGIKNEFVFQEGRRERTEYEEVSYLVTVADNNDRVNFLKMYFEGDCEDDKFYVITYDIINKAFDDLTKSRNLRIR